MIRFIPASFFEPHVLAIQTGLAIWIEDKCMALSEDQYNNLVSDLSSSLPCHPLSLLLSQLMSLYDSLLTRLQSLPLSVTSLNSLVPLLTAAFSRIPPPALGPAAFIRFFDIVHARLAALPNAYSDELRVCIDACVRGYGREWPSGMVPLSSSSQTQTQLGQLSIEVLLSPSVRRGDREQMPYSRSIEVYLCTVFRTFVETDIWNHSTKLSQTRSVPSHTRCWTPHIQDFSQNFKNHQENAADHMRLLDHMLTVRRESITYRQTRHHPSDIVQQFQLTIDYVHAQCHSQPCLRLSSQVHARFQRQDLYRAEDWSWSASRLYLSANFYTPGRQKQGGTRKDNSKRATWMITAWKLHLRGRLCPGWRGSLRRKMRLVSLSLGFQKN